MKREELIIELSAHRITIHNRGRANNAQPHTTFIQTQSASEQPEADHTFDHQAITQALRALINTNALTGSTAHCIYDLAPAAVSIISCPATLGPARARSAAELAAEEQATNTDDNVHTICDLGKDQTNHTDDAAAQPRRHMLIAAESDETLLTLRNIITEAGLRPGWLTPAAAVHAVALAKRAQQAQAPGVDVILGWRTTVIATHRAGRLVSLRTLAAGVDTMLKAADSADHNHTLEQLATATDPASLRTPTGQPLIPKVAPVLQRLGVELKQSLRLGIPDTDRHTATVTVWSTAGNYEWLAGMISTFIEVQTQSGKSAIDTQSTWQHTGIGRLGLLPRAKAAERRGKRVLAALWSGTAAACALLAAEVIMTRAEINAERDRIAAVATVRAEAERLVAQRDAATEAVDRQRRWSTAIDKALGESTDIAAVLHTLASSTPDPVRFEGLDIERDAQQRVICRLRGRVIAQGVAAASALGDFINAARSSPMIADANIRHVERYTTRDTRAPLTPTDNQPSPTDPPSASRFEIELTFVTTPYSVAHKPFNSDAPALTAPAVVHQPYDGGN